MESTRKCWRCGEAIVNDPHCDPVPSDPWRARHPEWEECVHATRARVAEVERELEQKSSWLKPYRDVSITLAAREAECAELRAACGSLLMDNLWITQRSDGDRIAAVLSRPPGSDAALRAIVLRAVELAREEHDASDACDGTPQWVPDHTAAAIVARLLEPPAEARDGGAR